MNASSFATEYFFDRPPTQADLARVPASVRDVVVAEVRIVGGPTYLVGRDQSGQPPILPRALFWAQIEIKKILVGTEDHRGRHEVYFGVPGGTSKTMYPHTPQMRSRNYFVISFVGNDGRRELVGHPVAQENYAKWEAGVSEYERARLNITSPKKR